MQYKWSGQEKSFVKRRYPLEGPHEEAEIEPKTMRQGKNSNLGADTCAEKERVRSKVTPRNAEWD